MMLGHEVTVIDSFFTGARTNVSDPPPLSSAQRDEISPLSSDCDPLD